MSRRNVDPELLPFLEQYPRFDLTDAILPEIRAGLAARMGAVPSLDNLAIPCEERRIPGFNGAPNVRLLIYGLSAGGARPAILHIHAGGHIMGMPEMSDAQHRQFVSEVACVVVSVAYRLAPENPYPAGLQDCLAALRWLYLHAAELGIDSGRIAIAGESAGAGMAVGLALLVRDGNECPVSFLSLVAPMLDDRTSCNEQSMRSRDMSWSCASNRFGWNALIGAIDDNSAIAYAVPARAKTYAGLPDTFIAVGSLDLFAQEDLNFARRLLDDDVKVELHLYPGAYHGFERVTGARVSQQFGVDRQRALKRAFGS